MDFVPRPRDHSGDHIDLPFVASFADNDLELDQSFQDMRDLSIPANISCVEYTNFINKVQSRLFFGTISRFLQCPIQLEDYRIRTRGADCFVTTTAMVRHLDQHWVSPEEPLRKRLCDYLIVTWDMLEDLDYQSELSLGCIPLLFLSTKLLLISLALVLNIKSPFWKHTRLGIRPLAGVDRHMRLSTSVLMQWLRDSGECPRDVLKYCASYNLLSLYYLLLVAQSNKPQKDDHSGCTQRKCVAGNLDENTYQTVHVHPECKCKHLAVNDQELRNIVCNGKVPLVKVVDDGNGTAKAVIQAATYQTRYIAISHVWKGGLGNPTANSLPVCQAKRLQALVNGCSIPTSLAPFSRRALPSLKYVPRLTRRALRPFWIDTLCIPVHELDKELRKAAMAKLDVMFVGAAQVLVLDEKMLSTNIYSTPRIDILAKLLTCNWSRRCWTLEEGCLSSCCKVQMADGCINPEHWWNPPWEMNNSSQSLLGILRECWTGRGFWMHELSYHDEAFNWGFRQPDPDVLKAFQNPIDIDGNGSLHSIIGYWQNCLEHCLRHQFRYEVQRPWRPLSNPERSEAFYCEAMVFARSDDLVTQFVVYWRGLGARSTSKDEDFIPILANLLGLSAAELLNIEDSSWRMLAIMKSLGQLPSSLLFDVGSRISGGDIAQHFRWLPARPGMQDVSRHSAMTINDAGIFLPDPDDKDSANPLTIFEVEGLAAKIAEGDSFLLRLRSFPISDLYKVKIHHNLSSGLSFNEDDKWAVLIETLTESKSLTLRGALFHVEHMETRKAIDISRALFYTSPRLRELDEASWGKLEATEYTGVYCSPLTFTKLLPSVTHTTDSQLECEEVPIWKVHLKCDSLADIPTISRRPGFTTFNLPIIEFIFVNVILPLLTVPPAFFLLTIDMATYPFSQLTTIQRVAGFMYIFWVMPESIFNILTGGLFKGRYPWVIAYLFAPGRKHGLSGVGIAFLVVASMDPVGKLLFLPIYRLWILPKLYDAWLVTYEDSKADRSKVSGWATSVVRAMGDLFEIYFNFERGMEKMGGSLEPDRVEE